MKKIEIEIPNGKKATQETKDGCIIIKFEDEWNPLSPSNTYDDFHTHAIHSTLKECHIYPSDTPDVVAYKKLKLIIKVINEGWKPDWSDGSQKKYYNWFGVLPSGSGFDDSITDYYYSGTITSVGSRLCFESSEKCEYVAKQFKHLYEQYLLIN